MTSSSLPTAEARIVTERPGRYLAQICEHISRLGAAGHRVHAAHGRTPPPLPRPRRVEHTATDGVIDFGTALCTLSAQDSLLILRLAADDPRTLTGLQDAMTRTLERVGRRDGLAVVWTAPPEAPAVEP